MGIANSGPYTIRDQMTVNLVTSSRQARTSHLRRHIGNTYLGSGEGDFSMHGIHCKIGLLS
jgi:hypothetical protein